VQVRHVASIPAAAALLLQAASPPPAVAQVKGEASVASPVETIVRTHELLFETAFDPGRFFAGERFGENMITIVYWGDSESWPGYGLAIRQGCLKHQPVTRDCHRRRTVRMVRAPAPPDQPRPRMRGFKLGMRMIQARATTREAVAAELERASMEWLEADLAQCPAASAVVGDADKIIWVAEEIHAPKMKTGVPAPPPFHADSVEVTFRTSTGRSTYSGAIEKGSAAAWATRLVEALEPCWHPAAAAPPWRR
jgi:hypothetical protein